MKCVAGGPPPCGHTALRVLAGVPLCLEHIQAMHEALSVPVPVAVPAVGEAASVVYYATTRDSPTIKIGVTQNVHRRIKALDKSRQKVRLLATEPGGFRLERSRHYKFRALRLVGSEWFTAAPVLTEHIDSILRTYGPPWCNCSPGTTRPCPMGLRKVAPLAA